MLTDLGDRWRLHANRRTILVLIIGGSLTAYLYLAFIQPPEDFPIEKLVSVPSGESLTSVANTLEEHGVIRSSLAFRLIVKVMGDEKVMHAGDYLFKEPKDVFAIARAIAIGQYGLEPYRVRVPEGATVREMSKLFSARLERFNAENFVAQATPQEGYLFPDTYFFLPNATEETVIQALRQNFDTNVAELQPLLASTTRPLSDIVIIASILEREAYNTQDRRKIAGVIYNRLAKDMPLQVDVTFAYTIGKGTFQLTKADLASDSPYNTYKYKGLPPGPIGNPSLDSLKAALTPIKSKYIFFLADHTGVTHFCETWECQQQNKEIYF